MQYQTIGKGEPLVFIHGLGQTQNAWELQKELSDQFQLFIPTLRGHGESLVTENMTLFHFAQDILKMLDENGIYSAHFCGLSLGGVIVQEIHSRAPKRVKSMILANTTSYVPSFAFDLAIRDRKNSLQQLSDEQYIAQIAWNTLHKPTEKELHQAVKTFRINREAYIPSSRAIRGINYLPLLNTSTPIHIIASSNDNVTPYLYNAQVTKMWAHKAKISVLNNTGHLSNIQKPMQFNQIVREFVGKQ
ncbi:pimeloyl-ACP methyl ester carboxylesterase [Psychrobacillus insolitus]|uniref:Pimeloyl-ACP methyl ester carboxylesterase n=1 Tax=Psychrobacillus insolitus TaxID=1461 RepID=A0A2W7MMC0_9BACI|nr:alpha/beta hydrolase [Psychrobacillus insolitus]PZX07920.1 pimeloyl-ACP methyl ester carboxylesterase [Psychrobacillus insolitus]